MTRIQEPGEGKTGRGTSRRATLVVSVAVTAIAGWTVFQNLHAPWAPLPWLAALVVWGIHFALDAEGEASSRRSFSLPSLALVVVTAAVLRLVWIHELPIGPYFDEVQTLFNTLQLRDKPLDLFGQTPLMAPDWVHTPNLYLCCNRLLLDLFGVDYLSLKLLSVLPGVLACAFFYLACTTLFEKRVATLAGLLFAVGHWPIRLSRYGWDASFLVMAFACSLWLLLRAFRARRPTTWAYAAGVVAGIALYSYIASRLCLVALLGVCAVFWIRTRSRSAATSTLAFGIGAVVCAAPLAFFYLENPGLFAVRTDELSIFAKPNPLALFVENLLGHAGMFHLKGGTYARDNFPGLPAMEPITGILLLVGAWMLVRRRRREGVWLLTIFALGIAPGLFSTSQEGPPYMYRTVAVMVPAFLICACGIEALVRSNWPFLLRYAPLVAALPLNFHYYHVKEGENLLATQVMFYNERLVSEAIREAPGRVYVDAAHVLSRISLDGAEPAQLAYREQNPIFQMETNYGMSAAYLFSGRYGRPSAGAVDVADFRNPGRLVQRVQAPALLVFAPRGASADSVRRAFPSAPIRLVRDLLGNPVLGLATIERR